MVIQLIESVDRTRSAGQVRRSSCAEVPKVRADLGFPPLVYPFVSNGWHTGLMNVISGERYKLVPTEIKDYVRGLYGRPPAPIKRRSKKKSLGRKQLSPNDQQI